MPEAHTHEIVLRGRIGSHLLGPFVDDFSVEHDTVSAYGVNGVTRLVGVVRDPAHLHGLVVFLASINAELVAITPITPITTTTPVTPVNPNPCTRSNS